MKKNTTFDTVWPYLMLISIVILVYCPVINHNFLYQWDDQWVVMNHYTTGGININNLWYILTDFYHGQYAPFNELNYLLLHTLFGYDSSFFHLTSLCWHLANVCLVYRFFIMLLSKSNVYIEYNIRIIAFFTALLWGIHPVNVESVAWLSASKVLIYTFFYLLSLLCYLKYVQNRRNTYFLLTLFFFICSFLGKEHAVTLPVCLLLIDYFVGRDFHNRELWVEKISFFSLSLLGGILTILSQGSEGEELIYSLDYRILFACYTTFEYMVKSFLPVNLSYIYPFPVLPEESIPLRLWFYPIIVLTGSGMLFVYRKNKIVMFSILFMVLHVAVALHLISISRFTIVVDRYLYLGCIGTSFLTVWIFFHFIQALSEKWKRLLISACFALYLIYLGTYCFSYTKDWKDTDTLKSHVRKQIKNRENSSPLKKHGEPFNNN